MCKKILTAVLVLLTSSVCVMGQSFEKIEFKKMPSGYYVEPVPPIIPLSVIISPIEGLFFEDEIVLTSTENLYDIEVVIVNDIGVVYTQYHNILDGEDIVIYTDSWKESNYTIYIIIDDDILVGNFKK